MDRFFENMILLFGGILGFLLVLVVTVIEAVLTPLNGKW